MSRNAPARLLSPSGPGPFAAALPPAGAGPEGPGDGAGETPAAALTAPAGVPVAGAAVASGLDGGEDCSPGETGSCGCPVAGRSGVREGACPGARGGAVPDGGREGCCDGGCDGCGAAVVGGGAGGAGDGAPGQIFSGIRLPGEQGAAVAGSDRTSGETTSSRAAADAWEAFRMEIILTIVGASAVSAGTSARCGGLPGGRNLPPGGRNAASKRETR